MIGVPTCLFLTFHSLTLLRSRSLNTLPLSTCSPAPPDNNHQCTNRSSIFPSIRFQIFECCWAKCDWQFEDPMDCFDHCIAEGTGHVQTHYANQPPEEAEYVCLWRGCIRLKKSMPAFPHMQRLIKHVREVHINKSGKIVQPHDRSK